MRLCLLMVACAFWLLDVTAVQRCMTFNQQWSCCWQSPQDCGVVSQCDVFHRLSGAGGGFCGVTCDQCVSAIARVNMQIFPLSVAFWCVVSWLHLFIIWLHTGHEMEAFVLLMFFPPHQNLCIISCLFVLLSPCHQASVAACLTVLSRCRFQGNFS